MATLLIFLIISTFTFLHQLGFEPFPPELFLPMLSALSGVGCLATLAELLRPKQLGAPLPTTTDLNLEGRLEKLRRESERTAAEFERFAIQSEENEKVLKAALAQTEKLVRAQSSLNRDQEVDAELIGLLALFQEKGRFVDFLMEDITRHADVQVGAVARIVHSGCRSILQQYMKLVPVQDAKEGDSVTVTADSREREVRLIGSVINEFPVTGKVVHRGWRAQDITLPKIKAGGEGRAPGIVAPAEIEV